VAIYLLSLFFACRRQLKAYIINKCGCYYLSSMPCIFNISMSYPVFKANELPEITVRIGLAYGHALVVLYGKNLEQAHLDIVGSSISLA
jgi:hypothetical protein